MAPKFSLKALLHHSDSQSEHNPLTMSDEQILEQIYSTHVHSDTKFDVDSLFTLVENTLRRSTHIVDNVVQGSKASLEPEHIDDKTNLAANFNSPLCTLKQINSEMSCKPPSEEIAHKTTLAILNKLSHYDWDAKAVLTLAAFALDYGEFWLAAQHQTTDLLAKSVAVLKRVPLLTKPSAVQKHRQAITELNSLVKITLQVIELIFELEKLTAYDTKDVPALEPAIEQIPVDVYWAIITIVAIVTQIDCLTTDSEQKQELSPYGQKINIILSRLRKEITECRRQIDEAKYYQNLRKLFQTPTEVMEVLKVLVFHKDAPQTLFDGATKTTVDITVLKKKNVYLFISTLDITDQEITVMKSVYDSTKTNEQYKIVWIPIVEEWTETLKKKFEVLRSKMPWYVVHNFTTIAGYKYIKVEWQFKRKPMVVVLNHQGKVQHTNAFHLIQAYGMKAFPFTIQEEDKISKEIHWLESVVGHIDHKVPIWGSSNRLRKRFSLRLRPRLRLLAMRMKRASIKSILNEVGIFVRKNIRTVAFSASFSIVFTLCFLFLKLTALPPPKIVPYSNLIASLQNGSVAKVLVEEGSRRIYYNTKSKIVENGQVSGEESQVAGVSIGKDIDKVGSKDASRAVQTPVVKKLKKFSWTRASIPEWQYSTRKIDHDEKFLVSLMREKGVTFSSAPQSVLMSMRSTLITVITLWIPLIPLMWLLYRQLSAANSPARKQRPNGQTVGFDDVQGVDSAKVELMEIVSCLQGDINYQKVGAKLPRGVLLVGPPGTGKTLLARAVAGEAGVPFFTVSASEFVELFVGRGAARIRDLFNTARKFAPSIIFIDELDAVGGRRGRSFNDERDQTLNQLLTEMDGFESAMRVVVIAATNRPEALDPALCRPGRFSRKVFVGEPDEEGRRKILAVHLKGVPLEEDVNIICHLVASLTAGFVGADLANIVNEAALLAARRGSETVAREDIMEAVERAKFGINDKQLRSSKISKELGKLFPWMPSLMGRSDRRQDDLQGPLGYQSLSS